MRKAIKVGKMGNGYEPGRQSPRTLHAVDSLWLAESIAGCDGAVV
jgi:hypothetical protein